MKKTLYIYLFAFISLLIASAFLASDERTFVIFVYSLILVVMLLNDFVNRRKFKALMIEIMAVVIFILYIVFTENSIRYSNIIIGLFPLAISIFQTFKELK